jgi:glyoxylate/hydroxypyruvate reductase
MNSFGVRNSRVDLIVGVDLHIELEPKMTTSSPIKGVYLSSTIDLKHRYGKAFEPFSEKIRLCTPQEVEDASEIKFALSWKPADKAFVSYPNLKLVSSIAAGVDCILDCSSLPADVMVTRICDSNQAYLIAGFAIWHVLWYYRNMRQYLVNESNHIWGSVDSHPLKGCVVGILGFGVMGQAVAKALLSLGFPVVAACRTLYNKTDYPGVTLLSGPNSVRNAASRANILINLLPLTTETRFLLNAGLFAAMAKASVLIQIGRGEHLVEEDLLAALDSGQLSAASLDVFRNEPLPPDHSYWDDSRIMVTPHDASEADVSVVVQQVVSSITDLAQGRVPRYAVDRKRGY